jgi:hypothetical protein
MPRSKTKAPPELADDNALSLLKEVVTSDRGIEVKPNQVSSLVLIFIDSKSTTTLVASKFKLLADIDFLIEVNREDWIEHDDEGRKALLHHLLCHCGYEDGEAVLRKPDYEYKGFASTLQTYGAWNDQTRQLTRVVNQLDLSLGNTEEDSDFEEMLDNITPINGRKKAS